MKTRILTGDAATMLRSLRPGSVDCVVTSPPYFGLRDYGTAKWDGGDPRCDHRKAAIRIRGNLAAAANAIDGGNRSQANRTDDNLGVPYSDVCGKCGARRVDKQIGLERTPDAFVSALADVFDEVYRVLKPEGTLWLNLGDSYASGEVGRVDGGGQGRSLGLAQAPRKERRVQMETGLRPKNLLGIPWRVAFELQKRGWYLRSDIIWHKPNPMPESVTDRPTKAHEYLFLLTKSERYFYDADAVKEPASQTSGWAKQRTTGIDTWKYGRTAGGNTTNGIGSTFGHEGTRNRRTVWTVTTRPFKGAHFATFPPKLIEPCILAGCPKDGLVLDPFSGAGTTGLVARQHGRRYVGIELNPSYVEMQRERLAA